MSRKKTSAGAHQGRELVTDELRVLVAQAFAAGGGSVDPGSFLATWMWRFAIASQAAFDERDEIMAGEHIIGAVATCAIWALNDVPCDVQRALYLNTFCDMVRQGAEAEAHEIAKSQRNQLNQSELQ